MEKICCIISAGDVNLPLLKEKKAEYDYFIAADLGFEKAKEAGITPNLLVGDFDSISQSPPDLLAYHPSDLYATQLKQFPIEKDYSDTHIAIEEGISLGYKHFHVYGALGGDRFSHSIANIQTMCGMKSKDIDVTLMGTNEVLYFIKDSSLTLSLHENSSFSIFSLTKTSVGVSIDGAKYPLSNHTLTNTLPLGLSNTSIEDTVTISVKSGTLLVIIEL